METKILNAFAFRSCGDNFIILIPKYLSNYMRRHTTFCCYFSLPLSFFWVQGRKVSIHSFQIFGNPTRQLRSFLSLPLDPLSYLLQNACFGLLSFLPVDWHEFPEQNFTLSMLLILYENLHFLFKFRALLIVELTFVL